MAKNTSSEIAALRREMQTAFRCFEVSVLEMNQIVRCLTISDIAMIKSDPEESVKQLKEIDGRLKEVERFLALGLKAVGIVDDDDDDKEEDEDVG